MCEDLEGHFHPGQLKVSGGGLKYPAGFAANMMKMKSKHKVSTSLKAHELIWMDHADLI